MNEVAIIGVGASGVAAARLARAKGAKAYVSDLRADAGAAAGADRIRALGADVDLGGHDLERIARADAVDTAEYWPGTEFEFVRLLYSDTGSYSFRNCSCSVDWPEAEYFFGLGVSRLARVAARTRWRQEAR